MNLIKFDFSPENVIEFVVHVYWFNTACILDTSECSHIDDITIGYMIIGDMIIFAHLLHICWKYFIYIGYIAVHMYWLHFSKCVLFCRVAHTLVIGNIRARKSTVQIS